MAQITNQASMSLPIGRAAVSVVLVGKHRGDADNLIGSVLDSLVSGGILLDDRLSCIPEISLKTVPGMNVGAEIDITLISDQ